MWTLELARETDEALSGLWGQRQNASDKLHSGLENLHYRFKDRPRYASRRIVGWELTAAQIEAKAIESLASGGADEDYRHGGPGNLARTLASIAEQREILARIKHEIEQLDKVYDASPWPRYFPCVTGNPHIHAGYGCSGLKHNSVLMWQPELSGHTVELAVEKLGPGLCSHCFPSAPVEYTRGEPDTSCPGSGQYVAPRAGQERLWKRYAHCPEDGCHYSGQVTQYGYIRKHQRKESA